MMDDPCRNQSIDNSASFELDYVNDASTSAFSGSESNSDCDTITSIIVSGVHAGCQRRLVTIDEDIDAIGIGKFHYWALAVLGLANASDAVEILCLSFILPHLGASDAEVQQISEEMSDASKSVLSASIFTGMLLGGITFGLAADKFGRRVALSIALATNAVFGFLSATTSYFPLLLLFRICAGFGVGGSIPGVFTLAAELLPSRNRGFYLSSVAWWWMIGSILAAGLAWGMLGTGAFGWKAYAAVCAIPAAVATLLVRFTLPESPRWLLLHGREREAKAVLVNIARTNNRISLLANDTNSLVSPIVQSPLSTKFRSNTSSNASITESTSLLGGRFASLRLLFGPIESFFNLQFRKTAVLLMIVWFSISFGWYGLILWIPTLFQSANVNIDPYQDAFLVAAANLPGNLLSAILMERLGRKPVLSISLFFACISAIALPFAKSEWQVVAAACLLNAVSTCSWNALDCLSTEVFPTSLRTTAMGLLSAVGRIGSIVGQLVFGNLIHKSVVLLLVSAGVVLAVGAIAAAMLPKEMMGQALDDIPSEGTKTKGLYTKVDDESEAIEDCTQLAVEPV